LSGSDEREEPRDKRELMSGKLERDERPADVGLGYMAAAECAASCIPATSPTAQVQQYTTERADNSLSEVGL